MAIGLLQGLRVTLGNLLRRSVTAHYPDAQPELPPRSRGVIALQEENCTSCMLCARECPSWCITIDSHKEVIPATTEGGRDRSQNVLDTFDIDYSLCMYCSICIEVCPFDALHWSPEFAYAEGDIADLTRLREWMWTVPPPQALDPGAEPSKEQAAYQAAQQPVVEVRSEAEARNHEGSSERRSPRSCSWCSRSSPRDR